MPVINTDHWKYFWLESRFSCQHAFIELVSCDWSCLDIILKYSLVLNLHIQHSRSQLKLLLYKSNQGAFTFHAMHPNFCLAFLTPIQMKLIQLFFKTSNQMLNLPLCRFMVWQHYIQAHIQMLFTSMLFTSFLEVRGKVKRFVDAKTGTHTALTHLSEGLQMQEKWIL